MTKYFIINIRYLGVLGDVRVQLDHHCGGEGTDRVGHKDGADQETQPHLPPVLCLLPLNILKALCLLITALWET